MTELAKVIKVRGGTAGSRLEIDGQEFPWYFTSEGVSLQVSRGTLPAVTLTIVAERVEVEHDLSTAKSDEARESEKNG